MCVHIILVRFELLFRSDTNRAIQPLKMARGLTFRN